MIDQLSTKCLTQNCNMQKAILDTLFDIESHLHLCTSCTSMFLSIMQNDFKDRIESAMCHAFILTAIQGEMNIEKMKKITISYISDIGAELERRKNAPTQAD